MGHLQVQEGKAGVGVGAPIRGVRVGPASIPEAGGVEEVAAGGHQGRAGGRGQGARGPGGWGQGAPTQGTHHLQGVGQVHEGGEGVVKLQETWVRRREEREVQEEVRCTAEVQEEHGLGIPPDLPIQDFNKLFCRIFCHLNCIS